MIRSVSGGDLVLESADGFDREVAVSGTSGRFASFLETGNNEPGDASLREVRRKRISV
jgi:hypothetical protein